MKYIWTICLSLLAVTALYAGEWTLSYQGFPYKSTVCALPAYSEGAVVQLSLIRPRNEDGQEVLAWMFEGETYLPGADFTMPAKDVVLVPIWESQAIEQVQSSSSHCQKLLRDGQLVIVRDGVEYTIMGVVIGKRR